MKLPIYEDNLVLECYIARNDYLKLKLFKANNFNNDVVLHPIWNATASVSFNDTIVRLNNILYNDKNDYVYNYSNTIKIPERFSGNIDIEIITKDGEILTASTKSIEPVKIKSYNLHTNIVELTFNVNDDSKYYRISVEKFWDSSKYHCYTKLVDFNNNNNNKDKTKSTFIDGDFNNCDYIFLNLAHVTKDIFEFQLSMDAAFRSNIDPFTMRATLDSNINGGFGIFSFYCIDTKRLK